MREGNGERAVRTMHQRPQPMTRRRATPLSKDRPHCLHRDDVLFLAAADATMEWRNRGDCFGVALGDGAAPVRPRSDEEPTTTAISIVHYREGFVSNGTECESDANDAKPQGVFSFHARRRWLKQQQRHPHDQQHRRREDRSWSLLSPSLSRQCRRRRTTEDDPDDVVANRDREARTTVTKYRQRLAMYAPHRRRLGSRPSSMPRVVLLGFWAFCGLPLLLGELSRLGSVRGASASAPASHAASGGGSGMSAMDRETLRMLGLAGVGDGDDLEEEDDVYEWEGDEEEHYDDEDEDEDDENEDVAMEEEYYNEDNDDEPQQQPVRQQKGGSESAAGEVDFDELATPQFKQSDAADAKTSGGGGKGGDKPWWKDPFADFSDDDQEEKDDALTSMQQRSTPPVVKEEEIGVDGGEEIEDVAVGENEIIERMYGVVEEEGTEATRIEADDGEENDDENEGVTMGEIEDLEHLYGATPDESRSEFESEAEAEAEYEGGDHAEYPASNNAEDTGDGYFPPSGPEADEAPRREDKGQGEKLDFSVQAVHASQQEGGADEGLSSMDDTAQRKDKGPGKRENGEGICSPAAPQDRFGALNSAASFLPAMLRSLPIPQSLSSVLSKHPNVPRVVFSAVAVQYLWNRLASQHTQSEGGGGRRARGSSEQEEVEYLDEEDEDGDQKRRRGNDGGDDDDEELSEEELRALDRLGYRGVSATGGAGGPSASSPAGVAPTVSAPMAAAGGGMGSTDAVAEGERAPWGGRGRARWRDRFLGASVSQRASSADANMGDAASSGGRPHRGRRMSRREVEEQLVDLMGRVNETESERSQLSKSHQKALEELQSLNTRMTQLQGTNRYLRSQLQDAQREVDSVAAKERRRAEEEMAAVKKTMAAVVERERTLMREQVARTAEEVKMALLRQQQSNLVPGSGTAGNADQEHS